MNNTILYIALLAIIAAVCFDTVSADKKKKLQIGVKKKVENCERRSKKGDVLKMHYTVRLFVLITHI